jgi:hypothetical protein
MTLMFERVKTVHALDSAATVISNSERKRVQISEKSELWFGTERMFREL